MTKHDSNIHDCPVCQNKMYPYRKVENFMVNRCVSCGVGITENAKPQANSYHRDDTYIKEKAQFANIFMRRINIIGKFKNKPGVILEVGSSTGILLHIMKNKGWKVFGVEPSKEAAEFAIKQGIPTLIAKFETAKLAVEAVDVVIINHTLEHLPNPWAVCDKAFKVLKDDGILMIDVPNFDSLSAKLIKPWPYLLPKEHLWHFTPEALSAILNQSGFEIVFQQTYSGIWDYGDPSLEIRQSFFGFKKRFFKNLLTLVPAFVTTGLNKGSDLTVVAKKTDV